MKKMDNSKYTLQAKLLHYNKIFQRGRKNFSFSNKLPSSNLNNENNIKYNNIKNSSRNERLKNSKKCYFY